jgi:hypothetical protein
VRRSTTYVTIVQRTSDLSHDHKSRSQQSELTIGNRVLHSLYSVRALQQLSCGKKGNTMKLSIPLYEGDGYLHYHRDARIVALGEQPVAQKATRVHGRKDSSLLKKLANWLDRQLQSVPRREVESYLEKSKDHADLERRMREIERKGRLTFG